MNIKKAKENLFPFLDDHLGKRGEGGVSKSLFQASPHPSVPVCGINQIQKKIRLQICQIQYQRLEDA